jgi:hypothetical protein
MRVLFFLIPAISAGAEIRFMYPDNQPATGISVQFKAQGQESGSCITDVSGLCALVLQDGTYDVALADPQFQPETARIRIRDGNPLPGSIRVQIATVAQQVTVSSGGAGELSLEQSANASQTVLDSDWLSALPALDQDAMSIAELFVAPGETATVTVDGMEVDELGIPATAIQEVRVNQSPFSAEYFRPSRARIDVITKSATTRIRGTIDGYFRDASLDARNAFAIDRPPARRRGIDGTVTGPIGKSGKTGFTASFERRVEDTFAYLYAITPQGLQQGNIPTPARETEASLRLQRNPNDHSSWSLRWEIDRESQDNLGAGGEVLPESAANATEREQSIRFSHNYFRQSSIHQFELRFSRDVDEIRSLLANRPRVVVEDAFTAGGAQADERSTRYRLSLEDSYGISTARDTLRFGVDMRDLSRRSYLDRTLRDGVLTFASYDDYVAGRPLSFRQRSGQGRGDFWNLALGAFAQWDRKVRDNVNVGLGLRYDYLAFVGSYAAPRGSIAWAPRKSKNTVIRAGAGFYTDTLGHSAIRDSLLLDGVQLLESLTLDPALPLQPPFSGTTPNLLRLNRDLVPPKVVHYTVGVERKLPWGSVVYANYLAFRGWSQFRAIDANAPINGKRPDPAVGFIRDVQSTARVQRHALDAGWRGRVAKAVNLAVNYTLGRTWSDSSGDTSLPANSLDLASEWSRTNGDRLQRFRALGDVRIAGFRTGLILSAQTGTPYNLTTGRDENGDGSAIDRPAGVSRNTLQGPGYVSLDARFSREFALGKQENAPAFRLSVDAFNLLNNVNYSRVVGNLRSPFFGQAVAASPARRLQISMRFTF